MCFHLYADSRFVSRLQFDDAPGMLDRFIGVATPRSLFCQPHEGPVRLGSEFCSLAQDPVVIANRKEIARIEARGELGISNSDRFAEPQHVDLTWSSRDPPDNLIVDLDELADIGKGMPELVEQLSEVRASLMLARVWPKLEGESRAVLHVSSYRDYRQKP
jgi:hypothetical protein